jgi:Molybdopterin converting factor, small subunit
MKILIPTPLRQYAGKKDAIAVQASTVSDALTKLTGEHPDLKRHLFTDEGKLRAFVNLYLNDDDVRYLADKENTHVNEEDSLSIIPSIAGGRSD